MTELWGADSYSDGVWGGGASPYRYVVSMLYEAPVQSGARYRSPSIPDVSPALHPREFIAKQEFELRFLSQ